MFVYLSMQVAGDDYLKGANVLPLAKDDSDFEELTRSWANFDAFQCACFIPSDKEHILQLIERSGGVHKFNAHVADLLQKLAARIVERRGGVVRMSITVAEAVELFASPIRATSCSSTGRPSGSSESADLSSGEAGLTSRGAVAGSTAQWTSIYPINAPGENA